MPGSFPARSPQSRQDSKPRALSPPQKTEERTAAFVRYPTDADLQQRETSRALPPTKLQPLRCPSLIFGFSHNNLAAINWLHSLPSQRFQTLLTLFPKSFSPFPHGTCLLSVSSQYLALEEDYLPFCAPLPKYATLNSAPHAVGSERHTGFSPSATHSSKKTYARSATGSAYQHYNSKAETSDLQVEPFPVHSPLLRESFSVSFPPLTYMLKFSG